MLTSDKCTWCNIDIELYKHFFFACNIIQFFICDIFKFFDVILKCVTYKDVLLDDYKSIFPI